jgi:hypothetical protein
VLGLDNFEPKISGCMCRNPDNLRVGAKICVSIRTFVVKLSLRPPSRKIHWHSGLGPEFCLRFNLDYRMPRVQCSLTQWDEALNQVMPCLPWEAGLNFSLKLCLGIGQMLVNLELTIFSDNISCLHLPVVVTIICFNKQISIWLP